MAEPIWITEELALTIHERQLARHGGMAGVRDRGLLQSALARPRHLLAYSPSTPSLAQLAGAYGFGIAKNHPLIDGNKRTAAVVIETFLETNGVSLTADDESLYEAFIGIAEGSITEVQFVDWIRNNIQPKE
jgi:death-on-curing protein